MKKHRLEAYTDAVIAIIITIMVLEFTIPHEASRHALQELIPTAIAYVMSFIFISIYRNNHHHMLHIPKSVNGSVLWANNVLLFFLSLIPFVTGWMSENDFAKNTVIAYGVVLLFCALSFYVLNKMLLCANDKDEKFRSVQGNKKGEYSLVLYVIGVIASFIHPYIALSIYLLVALMRLVPSKAVEKVVDMA